MKTDVIGQSKKKENQYDGRISSMLTQFMKGQFEATVAQFRDAKLSGNAPINKLMNVSMNPNISSITAPQNLSNITTSNQSVPVEPESTVTENEITSAPIPKTSGLSQLMGHHAFQDSVQEASQKYGVPVALINAVIKQESNFNVKAQSHCGAQGLMQLMPGTAKAYGCENSFDPKQNIDAGTHFLSDLLAKYKGDVALTLAGYNAGPGNVAKYGNTVPPFKETQDYVVKVGGYYNSNLAQMEQQTQKFASAAAKQNPARS